MGTGASNTNGDQANIEHRKHTVQAKVKAVGIWSRFSKWRQRESDRKDIRVRFDQLKLEKKEMLDEIDKLNNDADQTRFRRKSTQVPDSRVVRTSDKPFFAAFESDNKCFLCNNHIEMENGYPCRVCSRIFHKECITNCGEFREIDRELCYRASTNTGWSCYICGNLGLLLTDEETEGLVTKFDRYDINQDTFVSLNEYIKRRSDDHEQKWGKSPDDLDRQRYNLDFRLADIDANGLLDWWEFVNHEAQIILLTRPKDELVEMLTEKEVLKAKSLFRTFDRENNGYITEYGAKHAYRQWYQQLDVSSARGNVNHNDVIENHVNLCTKMFMNMDNTEHQCIFWSQFLDEQALYLLSSRPNQADILRKSPRLM